MKRRTQFFLEQLQVGPFVNEEAAVTLNGQHVGQLVREWKYYCARVNGAACGGGRSIPKALEAFASTLRLQEADNERMESARP